MQGLNLKDAEDTTMRDVSDDSQAGQPRKRPAVGDGISAGSGSPKRETPPPQPRRSRAHESPESDLQRPPVANKQLWTADRETLSRAFFAGSSSSPAALKEKAAKQSAPQPHPNVMRNESSASAGPRVKPTGPGETYARINQTDEELELGPLTIIREPETRPISQEQLVAEVKGIYAGLVMVEAKCIEVDNKQAALTQSDPASPPKLNNEQWQALIALHRTLLHEHHDFFLASQHPSASPALRRLASKYAMPARMWRHGIHSFLELLRHRLPASLDHMLAFIYLAYSMMALLYETVPAFEDTWIECLGDLGRYRMAIEDDDIRDRDVWTGVARHWYSKASDNAPNTGRLYHHLAILARPNALLQLFYYSKSLCVSVPFSSARDSILTLFDPVLNEVSGQGQYRLPPFDTAFVKAHGLLFTNKNMEKFQPVVVDFLDLLDSHIGRVTRKFMEQGYYIAITNTIAMLGYGSPDNPLMKAIGDASQETNDDKAPETVDEKAMKSFLSAEHLATEVLTIVLKRTGDPNVLSFIHVTLVFMYFMSSRPRAMGYLEARFPWQLLTEVLNQFLASFSSLDRIEDPAFPLPIKDHIRPLIEDFAMRGLIYADGKYYPETWFTDDKLDDEERYLEVASMVDVRKERILWLAHHISRAGSWISYDREKRQFSTTLIDVPALDSRVSTFQSEKSVASNIKQEEMVEVKIEVADGSDTEQTSIEMNRK
jgi:hypothetical protein